jgi:hypothetical protein
MKVRNSTHTLTFTSRSVRRTVCEPVFLHRCKCKSVVAVRADSADSPVNCRFEATAVVEISQIQNQFILALLS